MGVTSFVPTNLNRNISGENVKDVNVGIYGFGSYIPSDVRTNKDLEVMCNTSDSWITEKTGIKERRVLPEENATSYMCIEAAKNAIKNCGIDPADIDAIVITTFTQDYVLPSTALIVKDAIGANKAIPIDLNQVACAGTVYGMFIGRHLLLNPNYKNILVIGAEAMSRITNPNDRSTYVFFGDAAGAFILRRMKKGIDKGILNWDIQSKLSMDVHIPGGGSKSPLCKTQLEEGKNLLHMNGREVWKKATTVLPQSIEDLLYSSSIEPKEIDLFLFHQANLNIIKECMKTLEVPFEKTYTNVSKLGNTSAASLPVVFNEAIQNGKIKNNNLIVLSTIGAGFLWGSMLVKHSTDAADFE